MIRYFLTGGKLLVFLKTGTKNNIGLAIYYRGDYVFYFRR